jgi:hypothetical protein
MKDQYKIGQLEDERVQSNARIGLYARNEKQMEFIIIFLITISLTLCIFGMATSSENKKLKDKIELLKK